MLIVACGAYRTGSTAQYNLVGAYVEACGLGRRLGLVEPDDVAALPEKRGAGWYVAKCHHVVAGYRDFARPTAWADLVLAGRARPIGTLRDVASVRASMCRKFGLAADEVDDSVLWREAQANTRRWHELAAVWQPYDLIVDTPAAALRQLVDALGMPWDPGAAVHAASAAGAGTAHAIMGTLAPGTYDPVSLLHWDHVSDAELARCGARREGGRTGQLSSPGCPPL